MSFALVAAWWTWNLTRPLPTDVSLRARFQDHRPDLDSLATAALADTLLVGAAHDWTNLAFEVFVRDTPQNDRLLTAREVSATGRAIYRRLLDRAGLPAVSRREGEVWFIVGSSGGVRKGLLYSEARRDPVRVSLDGLERARYVNPAFVRLAPHWYLFIEPRL